MQQKTLNEEVEAMREAFAAFAREYGPEHPRTISAYKRWSHLQAATGWNYGPATEQRILEDSA